MGLFTIILVAAATFGICYLFDKGFSKVFRGKEQHKSGLSVKLSKRFAAFGAILSVLGILAICTGLNDTWILTAGGVIVLIMGVCLAVYYATFGIFYDADSFILTTFGKKSATYTYRDIRGQRLYVVTGGSVVVELHMNDGRTVSLQSTMEGTYPFLDHAFAAWCRQTGRDPKSCTFHDPANSLWFPTMEEV